MSLKFHVFWMRRCLLPFGLGTVPADVILFTVKEEVDQVLASDVVLVCAGVE